VADGTRTPETAPDVLRAIMDAGVSLQAARMLAAQSAFETGGFVYIWNFNLGNITTNSSDYVVLPGNSLHFTPYDNLQTGALGFVTYLQHRGLLPFAESGDLQGYVDRLQAIGYAGDADYGAYYNGMASWYSRLGGVVPSFPMKTIAQVGIVLFAGYAISVGIRDGIFDDLFRAARRVIA
jgi:hypothetical protein